MAKRSAGILMYRRRGPALELLLVHPGGPFWSGKDLGAWSLPKGEYGAGEDPLAAARREFAEEIGSALPDRAVLDLGAIKQPGGKVITAFAFRPRMAATKRADANLSRGRSGEMVLARRRAGEDPPGTIGLRRPIAGKPRPREWGAALATRLGRCAGPRDRPFFDTET